MHLGWNHSGLGNSALLALVRRDVGSALVLVYGVTHGSMSALFSLANLRAVCYDLFFFGIITGGLVLWRARYVLNNSKLDRI